jgi:hypothetical protein
MSAPGPTPKPSSPVLDLRRIRGAMGAVSPGVWVGVAVVVLFAIVAGIARGAAPPPPHRPSPKALAAAEVAASVAPTMALSSSPAVGRCVRPISWA